MCKDTSTSFFAYLFSLVIAIYLIYRNNDYDRWNASFIITFAQVQLWEGLIWVYGAKKSEVNDLLTRFLLITIAMEPLVQTFLGALYTGASGLYMMSILFVYLLVYELLAVNNRNIEFSSIPGKNGHLVWSRNDTPGYFLGNNGFGIIFGIGMFIPLLYMENNKGLPLILIGIFTILFTLLTTTIEEFNSYWCFTAMAYSLYALFN